MASPPRRFALEERVAKKPNPIDVHVGGRVRARRTMRGLSQSKLGKAIDTTFQQVQKYEHGTNRVSASRLHMLSQVLDVPISYFFDELPDDISGSRTPGLGPSKGFEGDPLAKQETQELVNAYYRMPEQKMRQRVRELVKALAGRG
ncbi:MAG: helix-turn-helix transcriptional regulator [Rhodospirillaceae bacterium]|jgi:transcriptional regulator with XRE-family HTH domain|nr:helix-turn-helix transcriptional regulator [Rhodospirillaceae bacterium]MBT5675253.1 helix-turn-helix transcriptional regulator [Rhodospirillaceae bacterium]MBT5778062.1 helix-turn-helix transcriptional regulator [Rhodospirillaceae bacterium]MBT6828221.1 helix-turn-helix transcriptional regulator [Rhodospirillaceae bacterium]